MRISTKTITQMKSFPTSTVKKTWVRFTDTLLPYKYTDWASLTEAYLSDEFHDNTRFEADD